MQMRSIKGQKKGFGPFEKWLLGSEDRVGGQGKVEEDRDKCGDKEILGTQVKEIKRKFEEGNGVLSPKEGAVTLGKTRKK